MGKERKFRFLVGAACFGWVLALGGCSVGSEEISTEEAGQELAAACTVRYNVSSWGPINGKPPGLMASVTITNNDAPIDGWVLRWTFNSGEVISSGWNATVTQTGSAARADNASWNGKIPTGGKADFGFIATTVTSPPLRPTGFSLNGKTCTLL
jgi:cellulose 1,4-beta-cellobiosidase